jgi:hypothetical protein
MSQKSHVEEGLVFFDLEGVCRIFFRYVFNSQNSIGAFKCHHI